MDSGCVAAMSRVYTAAKGDVKDAAETIVKAFIHDPFNLYFYNLMEDPGNPPWGTKEVMALHIRNRMITEPVLVVDDGDKRCAGVALWDTPKMEPVGWCYWSCKKLHSCYGSLMGYLYYRNRGINRRVSDPSSSSGKLMEALSRVSEDSGRSDEAGSWKRIQRRYLLFALFGDSSKPSRSGHSKCAPSTCPERGNLDR